MRDNDIDRYNATYSEKDNQLAINCVQRLFLKPSHLLFGQSLSMRP